MDERSGGGGHVWLVGAGPGDPGLLTLAGQRALAGADVVVYDALVSPAILRHAQRAERIYAGKRAGAHAMRQEEIDALLVCQAQAGKRVVRLKGGDPFVFGRGGEEALACRAAGVPFTVVPGITSAIAAPAYAGVPVTHRTVASSFLVLTGSEAGGDDEDAGGAWDAAPAADTIVVLMGARALPAVVERLLGAGKAPDTPAACVRWGTRQDQRVVRATLGTIGERVAAEGLTAPFVTVVGPSVALADEMAWFQPGPLAGKSVVVTRARDQASDLAEMLAAKGATVIEAPAIATRRLPGTLISDERVSSRWDWIVFASVNGVDAFFDELRGAGRDARALHTTQLAAIGSATAEALARHALVADFEPSRAIGETLAAELPRVSGARVLLPGSALADGRIADGLRARGAHVEQVAIYTSEPQPLEPGVLEDIIAADAITFSSASTADNLKAALGEAALPATVRLVSIGPRTSDAVRAAFGRVDAEAKAPSLASLVEAVERSLTSDGEQP